MKQALRIKFGSFFKKSLRKKENFVSVQEKIFNSVFLDQEIRVDIYKTPFFKWGSKTKFSLLLFNDGQDMKAVDLILALQKLTRQNQIKPLIVVGIYPKNRMQEYGTAHQTDYANRGSKAKAYTQFITQELLPYLESNFPIAKSAEQRAFAGFSLGGLSAFDMVWNQPETFGKVGVFSGSLWWRSKEFNEADPDGNRIVHELVEQSNFNDKSNLKFWLQAGTEDEKEDRNNNGIIDAIDDTLDLMQSLQKIGFHESDMTYVEVEGGQHNPNTWKDVLPDFLIWAFGK